MTEGNEISARKRRKKVTKSQRRLMERKARKREQREGPKIWLRVSQQPKKMRGSWVATAVFTRKRAPKSESTGRRKESVVQINLGQYPARLSVRGKKLKVTYKKGPRRGEPFFWGEAASPAQKPEAKEEGMQDDMGYGESVLSDGFPSHPRMVHERLCYEMAKECDELQVTKDGKSIKYVDPDGAGLVCDGKAIKSCECSEPKMCLSHEDHWTRALMWSLQGARLGGESPEALKDIRNRMIATKALRKLVSDLIPEQVAAYRKLFGKSPDIRKLSIGCSAAPVLTGKVGRHEGPRHGLDYSVITVHPNAFKDLDYLRSVVKHELIHYILGEDDVEGPHEEKFEAMAREVGLDKKYRD